MVLTRVRKRDGSLVPFDQDKITNAVFSAAKVVAEEEGKEADYNIAKKISGMVVEELEESFEGKFIPTVEYVQDSVERRLIKSGFADTSKEYILYRQKHKELREASDLEKSLIADVVRTVKDYTRGDDWEVKENANTGSIVFQGLTAHLAGKSLRMYALNWMYGKNDPKIKKLHEDGAIHIHDLNFPLIAYCCGHSIDQLIKRGFGEVPERVQSSPAKHLETIVAQMVNYIGTEQGEFAGAQAFSSVDTHLAPFVRADNLSQERVDQYMQMLIYGLNVPSRWGWQAPFSNLTFDVTVPEDLKDKKVIIGITEEEVERRYENRLLSIKEIAEAWSTDKEKAFEYLTKSFEDEEFERQKQIFRYRTETPARAEMEGLFEKIKIRGRGLEWKVVELFFDSAFLPKEVRREYLINGTLNIFNQERESLLKILNSTYGDYQKEMDMINLAFLKTMIHGDKSGRVFTFPIPTYNLTKDFPWDSEVSNKIFEATGKYGLPYFQNYIGSDLDPGEIRAMCCRLNIDQTELMNRPGGMWGPGDSTGSIGVVTINMNRIGYEAKDETEFFKLLEDRMNVASNSLEIKRETIEDLLEKGFVPYTKSYIGHFSNHFSTIGLCGMNEACINFMDKDISTKEGKDFTIKTLRFMREKLKEYQNKTGNLYNLEATPAESTSYRFALKDRELYKHIHVSGDGAPFLTNSTHLPVDADTTLYEALKHQEDIQVLYTGGTIFHAYLKERIDREAAKTLVRKIAETTRLPYYCLTPVFSVCQDHGYLTGKQEICPSSGCSKEPEMTDRVVGYLRPVSVWNDGKRLGEFPRRKRINKAGNYVWV